MATKEETFRQALEAIANPLIHLQRKADESGARLNGMGALALCNDPNYLRGIARKALEEAAS